MNPLQFGTFEPQGTRIGDLVDQSEIYARAEAEEKYNGFKPLDPWLFSIIPTTVVYASLDVLTGAGASIPGVIGTACRVLRHAGVPFVAAATCILGAAEADDRLSNSLKNRKVEEFNRWLEGKDGEEELSRDHIQDLTQMFGWRALTYIFATANLRQYLYLKQVAPANTFWSVVDGVSKNRAPNTDNWGINSLRCVQVMDAERLKAHLHHPQVLDYMTTNRRYLPLALAVASDEVRDDQEVQNRVNVLRETYFPNLSRDEFSNLIML